MRIFSKRRKNTSEKLKDDDASSLKQ